MGVNVGFREEMQLNNNITRVVGGYTMVGVIGKRAREGNAMEDASEYMIEENEPIFLKYNLFSIKLYFQCCT